MAFQSWNSVLPEEALHALKVKEGDTLYLTDAPEADVVIQTLALDAGVGFWRHQLVSIPEEWPFQGATDGPHPGGTTSVSSGKKTGT